MQYGDSENIQWSPFYLITIIQYKISLLIAWKVKCCP
jgi:hypothetical protein